jgi:hypothetical protein
MQGSGAHRRGRSTGALLLPVGAVVCGEPSRTLARDETRVRAYAERRLLQPRDHAEAGCEKTSLRSAAVMAALRTADLSCAELRCAPY